MYVPAAYCRTTLYADWQHGVTSYADMILDAANVRTTMLWPTQKRVTVLGRI